MSAGQPPALAEVLANCEAGRHELTKLTDLEYVSGTIEWCKNCGSLIAVFDLAEPQNMGWKPRVLAERKE
jgi:hypothetical protein